MATLKERVRRKALRLYLRIVHEKATPEYIARGWAIGMFYGCLIPFGLQLALSIPTAFLLKGSKVGARSKLRYVILDKNVTVKPDTKLQGTPEHPLYISKGVTV